MRSDDNSLNGNKTSRTVNEKSPLGLLYFVFALVAAAQRALHGVAALHADLSPHHHAGRRLLGALHHKTAAAHAEGRGDLGQDFRKSLEGGVGGGGEGPLHI